MANILQKIFYTKDQCAILDLIKANKDSVNYNKDDKHDKRGRVIGTIHKVTIETNDHALSAHFIKYKPNIAKLPCFSENEVSYTFVDRRPYMITGGRMVVGTVHCGNNDDFAHKVYKQMLNHYIRQHGCPVCR